MGGKVLSHRSLLLPAAVLLASIFGAAAPTQTGAPVVPPIPDGVKPIRVSGLGIRVSDLERSRKFYTEVLGLKVGAKVPAQGEPVEYLLGVRLSQSDAERPAALGSEANRNGDGRAQYCLSRSQRVLFRIFLYYRLADCGINETRW